MQTLVWIPILFCAITTLGYVIPYIISTSNGHVYYIFPAISETGNHLPESLFFRELLNLSGFLSICNVYVRYEQYNLIVAELNASLTSIKKINLWCLINGVLGGIGVTFVANFKSEAPNPLNTEQKHIVPERSIHHVAAFLVFVTGILYCILQTFLSFQVVSYSINTLKICYIRLILTMSAVFNFSLFIIGKLVLKNLLEQPTNNSRIREDPWFYLHVIANFSEWLMCLSFTWFALTFISEFQKIEISAIFKFNNDKSSNSSQSISSPSVASDGNEQDGINN